MRISFMTDFSITGSFITSPVLLKFMCCLAVACIIFSSIPGALPVFAENPPQQQREGSTGPGSEALAAKQAGDEYSKLGETQKAIDSYEQALKAYPAYVEVYYLLGLIYDLQQGNLKKAIACYQKFLELAPDSPDARDVRLLIESAEKAAASSSSDVANVSNAPDTSNTSDISNASDISTPASPATSQSDTPAVSANSATAAGTSTSQPSISHPAPPPSPASSSEEEQVRAASVSGASQEADTRVTSVPDTSKTVRSSDIARKEMRSSDVSNRNEMDRKEKASPSKNIRSAPGFSPSEQFVFRSIDDKVLKYSIKIAVWEREGYIQKFNELALVRGSSLTSNVSEVRAKLREERQKTTAFIDYTKEAEHFLQRKMLNDLLREWGMDLSQLPQKVDLQKAIPSCEILNVQEDNKYVQLSLKAKIDVRSLREQLLKLGYQFTPTRIQLQCSNLYGEAKDRFIEAIQRKSECLKSQSEGLYEIYMPAELFASELGKMTIGTYAIHLDSVGRDKIIFTAEPKEK